MSAIRMYVGSGDSVIRNATLSHQLFSCLPPRNGFKSCARELMITQRGDPSSLFGPGPSSSAIAILRKQIQQIRTGAAPVTILLPLPCHSTQDSCFPTGKNDLGASDTDSRKASRNILPAGFCHHLPTHGPGSTLRLQSGAGQRYHCSAAGRNWHGEAGARPGDSQP